MTTVKCPTCGAAVEWSKEQHWKPFCSERCKQIDLGTWAGEGYRIPERPGRETDEEPSIRDDESET